MRFGLLIFLLEIIVMWGIPSMAEEKSPFCRDFTRRTQRLDSFFQRTLKVSERITEQGAFSEAAGIDDLFRVWLKNSELNTNLVADFENCLVSKGSYSESCQSLWMEYDRRFVQMTDDLRGFHSCWRVPGGESEELSRRLQRGVSEIILRAKRVLSETSRQFLREMYLRPLAESRSCREEQWRTEIHFWHQAKLCPVLKIELEQKCSTLILERFVKGDLSETDFTAFENRLTKDFDDLYTETGCHRP